MNADQIKIENEWKQELLQEFEEPYMKELRTFLQEELSKGKTIFPHGSDIFNALNHAPLSKVKVVILGQDPYHGPGQAHGLSFSVKAGVRPPPSLKNIFKELQEDLNIPPPSSGELTKWASQGVLLLNTVLTVENGMPASHKGRGWEKFTDKIIHILSKREDPIVFILWGNFAQTKAGYIRVPPHAVIKSAHPSPFSAHQGFLGSRPFSKTNEYLKKWGKTPIDWSL